MDYTTSSISKSSPNFPLPSNKNKGLTLPFPTSLHICSFASSKVKFFTLSISIIFLYDALNL